MSLFGFHRIRRFSMWILFACVEGCCSGWCWAIIRKSSPRFRALSGRRNRIYGKCNIEWLFGFHDRWCTRFISLDFWRANISHTESASRLFSRTPQITPRTVSSTLVLFLPFVLALATRSDSKREGDSQLLHLHCHKLCLNFSDTLDTFTFIARCFNESDLFSCLSILSFSHRLYCFHSILQSNFVIIFHDFYMG